MDIRRRGGYRSTIFISIMRMRGYHNLVDISGGLKAMKESCRFRRQIT